MPGATPAKLITISLELPPLIWLTPAGNSQSYYEAVGERAATKRKGLVVPIKRLTTVTAVVVLTASLNNLTVVGAAGIVATNFFNLEFLITRVLATLNTEVAFVLGGTIGVYTSS